MAVMRVFVALIRTFLLRQAAIVAENLALRQQIIVLQQSVRRPRLRHLIGCEFENESGVPDHSASEAELYPDLLALCTAEGLAERAVS